MRIVVKKSQFKKNKQTNMQGNKNKREREREGETEKGTDRDKGDTADFFPFFVKHDWGYLFFFLLKRD